MGTPIFKSETLTIASGQTTSGAIAIGEYSNGSIQLPAALTGATLTAQVSNDNSTWANVKDTAGSDKGAITFVASKIIPLYSEIFNSKFLRFVSASSEGADRSLKLFFRG